MRHQQFEDEPRQRVAITGSHGMIGTELRNFLSTGGHDIAQVVRSGPTEGADEVYWKPRGGEIEAEKLEGVDVVVHLAGENLANGRWTNKRKRKILESRRQGTELLAETLANLDEPPHTFISASAVGFYGDTGETPIDESAGLGSGFLAEVCEAWESAAEPAREAGIRTVHPRFGLVLSGNGGALDKMLTPFKLGVGGRIGGGDQYMSWIDVDDVVGALQFIMFVEELDGPVNVASPNPVTNEEFTSTLGDVLNRPTIFPIPGFAIKTLFGEMGEETLLSGQRVVPAKLEDAGFRWEYPELEAALRHQLGR